MPGFLYSKKCDFTIEGNKNRISKSNDVRGLTFLLYNYSVINYSVITERDDMALRDHSLDGKITNAAFKEFLQKGYRGASLRKIAGAAGVTVGAIQIRYRSKDELFVCLLKPLLDDIKIVFENTKADYFTETDTDILTKLKESMKNESVAIIRLIFDHYEQAVLLLCRSAGSSLEQYFDAVVQSKIKESVTFFREAGGHLIDEKLLGLLISAQFDDYRRIVSECPDRETAEKYMDSLMTYHSGGWTALFAVNDINTK